MLRTLICCWLFAPFIAMGQQNEIDRLEAQLQQVKPDTSKVNILCAIADKYLAYQPTKAKQYATEALMLSRELAYQHGQILALNRLGEFQFRQSNYAKAVELITQSLGLAEEIGDSVLIAQAYRVLGNINTAGLKRYDTALQYQLKALAIHKKQNDVVKIASDCGSISWIYAMTHQHLDEGHRLANLGIRLSDSLQHHQFLSYNYNSKGLLYEVIGKYDSANFFFDLSIEAARKAFDNTVIAYNNYLKGEAYISQNKLKDALRYFQFSLDESKSVNSREVIKNSYSGLSKTYYALGDYKRAYENHTLYSDLKDSILNSEVAQKTLMIEMESEEAKREAEISDLQRANRQASMERTTFIIALLIGLLLMATIAVLAILNNRNKQKANALLQEKNRKIEKQNEELVEVNSTKDKLFSIIGHDLRSPILNLKSLLEMVIKRTVSVEEFQHLAPRLNQQVIGINETLENLLQWSRTQQERKTRNPRVIQLNQLIAQVIGLLISIAEEKKISISNRVPTDVNVYGDKNEIELVFRNLIHNAIKFTPENGSITVGTKIQDGQVNITVVDTGVGMTKEQIDNLVPINDNHSTMGTSGEQGTGLGIGLCYEMVKTNGGTLTIDSTPGKGSVFTVTLTTPLTQ